MKKIIFIVLLLIATVTILAFEWPLSVVKIAATFGTPYKSRPIAGVILSSTDESVLAAGSGKVLFYEDVDSHTCPFSSGIGSFIAIQHDNSFISIYGGLKNGTVAGYLKDIKDKDPIGFSGTSGITKDTSVLFYLYDTEKKQYVNPLMFLPKVEDTEPPVIKSVIFSNGNQVLNAYQINTIKQGEWNISVSVSDSNSDWSLDFQAPFSVRILINGKEIVEAQFDIIREEGGKLFIFQMKGQDISSLYSNTSLLQVAKTTLIRGKVKFEITVKDFAGNERTANYQFNVE